MRWFLISLVACGGAPTVVEAGAADDASAFDAGDTEAAASPRFVTEIIQFNAGECAGFGESSLPTVVQGPPEGAGDRMGGLDVLSLGSKGEITLGFAPAEITDGPGPDFIVFENAFYVGGDPQKPFAEPAEISVSEDGVTWKSWPCTQTSAPFGACSGWKPVFSNTKNGISPFDPARAGGEAYDLAEVGLSRARYVRVRDVGSQTCPSEPSMRTRNMGFDLDAIAIIHPR